MWILPLLFLTLGFAGALFGLGRFFNPARERLPLQQMDQAAVLHTIARGWSVLNSAQSLSRITSRLHPRCP